MPGGRTAEVMCTRHPLLHEAGLLRSPQVSAQWTKKAVEKGEAQASDRDTVVQDGRRPIKMHAFILHRADIR